MSKESWITTYGGMVPGVPIHSPYYGGRPYTCELRVLKAFCEAPEEAIWEILACTPFEYITNKFAVSVEKMANMRHLDETTAMDIYDAFLVIPAKFEGTVGAYAAYEYNTAEKSVASGRETYGYPMKLAKVELVEEENQVRGTVERHGVKIIDISCELSQGKQEAEDPFPTYPHLLLRVIPAANLGAALAQVITRDTSKPPSKVKIKRHGKVAVTFGKSNLDPVYKLGPTKVLAGTFTVSNFFSARGKVLANL